MKPYKLRISIGIFTTLLLLAWMPHPALAQEVDQSLPAWEPGILEIHHVSTGRGSSTFFIFPDATTMLYDAGEFTTTYQAWRWARFVPGRPDTTQAAGVWLTNYIARQLVRTTTKAIDYGVLSHFHWDHYGQVTSTTPFSSKGNYKLTGITAIGDALPIGTLLDRAWGDYSYPANLQNDSTFINYQQFITWQQAHNGLKMVRFTPGLEDQIVLKYNPQNYADFKVQNIAANGVVWTGEGTQTQNYFPSLSEIPEDEYPTENMSSVVLTLNFGDFDYYTGGDLRGISPPGFPDWHDMETPVARVVGEVDMASLNHHGYVDSQNEFFVATLQPRVWIIPVWDSAHPTHGVYKRIFSEKLYPGPRDAFATNMHEANKKVVVGLDKLKSDQGHIVVRVKDGGASYMIYVLDNTVENGLVKSVHGPYASK